MGLTEDVFYRLDAKKQGSAVSFSWPSGEVLKHLPIGEEGLGVLAWASELIGGSPRRVLIPIQISDDTQGTYQALILPEMPLRDLRSRVVRLLPDGRPASAKALDRAEAQYLAKGVPRRVDIAVTSDQAGLYYVELSARTVVQSPSGQQSLAAAPATVSFYFRHYVGARP